MAAADVKADPTDELLRKAYYRPGGYQGAAALQAYLVKQDPKTAPSLPVIRKWLAKQQLVQLHQQKAPPVVSKPDLRQSHFTGLALNDLHMVDLLTMPRDPEGYTYILSLIDCATRYKAARPLNTKLAGAVAIAIQDIYSTAGSPLKWPKVVNVDAGTEFKGEVSRMYEKHGTRVRVGQPGFHQSQSFVEAMNKVLSLRLFKAMEARELATGKKNTEWASELPAFVSSLNSEKTRLLGVSPDRAVVLAARGKLPAPSGFTAVPGAATQMRKPDTIDSLLPQGSYRIRTLGDRPVEGGPRRRATDVQWSHSLHSILRAQIDPSGAQPTLYFMSGTHKHGLKKQDLLLVKDAVAVAPPPTVVPEEKKAPHPLSVPVPVPLKKKIAPRYRAAPKNNRELMAGLPIHVSSRGRVIRQA